MSVSDSVDKSREAKEGVDVIPEGGWSAWLTVLGSFLIQFCGFGYTTSFGVYQDFYARHYLTNSSASTISWIGSVNAFLVVSGGLVAGRLFDRGYFYWLLYGGSILISFSLFMLSLAKPNQFYQIFLSQGLGHGIGAGMIYVPSIAILAQYFRQRRSLVMTIVASGSSLGAIVHPIMLNNLLNSPLGFGNTIRANTGLVSGFLLISCLLMRTRLPPPTRVTSLRKALRKFSRDTAYIFAVTGMTIFTMAFYLPVFFVQLDSATRGLNPTFSFYTLVILNASSFLGRLTPGPFIHKLGVGNIITGACGCCAVMIFAMMGIKTLPEFVVFGIIFGFFAGSYITMNGPLMALLTDDFSELGARMGVAFAFIGGPINGALLGDELIWWRASVVSGVSFLIFWFLKLKGSDKS
ncbi:MFS general substrate transporter [Dendrothele bispora CBS 962.96]|uniref:MFS general substrate transporter n=1 Tax=Dendrothele bispora (strain CBS 962.96) TaxID=1314807 RepID=A0A4S8MV61_DENBC|nr:MFS general substrate transporter [Dendrothele bispora CBS 962.96]